MIVDVHQDHGRNAVHPCVVAEGLTEAVAGDMALRTYGDSGFMDDAPCLVAGDRLAAASAGEEVCARPVGQIYAQCPNCLLIQCDFLPLAGLLLG